MPVSAEAQLRLSSHEKAMPTYIVSFVGDTEQQNFLYCKKILSASVRKRNSTMSTEKYQSGLFNDWCQVFFFNSIPKLYLDDVDEEMFDRRRQVILSIFDMDRSSFLADIDYNFFLSLSVNNVFLPSQANVFLAE